MKNKAFYWYIVLIITFIVWGTQHPPLKILSGEIGPNLLNFLRFLFAGIALLPIIIARKRKIKLKDFLIICLLGFFGIFLNGTLSVIGINLSTAINNAIFINTWPLMLVILAPILIKEKITKKATIGILIGFIGMVIALMNGERISDLLSSEFFIGNLLIILAAFFLAIFAIYNKKYIKKYGGLETTFYAVLGGTFFLFLSSLISREIFEISTISLNSLLLILWIAIPTTAIGWVVWFTSVNKIGLVKTSSFFLLIPVSGILSSYIFLQEEITEFTIIGTVLILMGIYIVQKK